MKALVAFSAYIAALAPSAPLGVPVSETYQRFPSPGVTHEQLVELYAPHPLFTGDRSAEIEFAPQWRINQACGAKLEDKIIACVDAIGGKRITMPNPCHYADREFYALILCHELSHLNGWMHGMKG